MTYEPGEGPVSQEQARANIRAFEAKDNHRKPKPGDEDRRTDNLDDPKHNKE